MKPSLIAPCREATDWGAWGRNTVAARDDWPTSRNMSKYCWCWWLLSVVVVVVAIRDVVAMLSLSLLGRHTEGGETTAVARAAGGEGGCW